MNYRVTEEQINGTKARLQELRELRGNDEAVYDDLYRGLDPGNALASHAASELTGINTYDNNFELDYWDKVIEIENDAFGADKNTEQYRQYQADFWRLTVDKMEKEILPGLFREEWELLDDNIREILQSAAKSKAIDVSQEKKQERHLSTSLADRLAAAKEQCAQQQHDRPTPKHDRGIKR